MSARVGAEGARVVPTGATSGIGAEAAAELRRRDVAEAIARLGAAGHRFAAAASVVRVAA